MNFGVLNCAMAHQLMQMCSLLSLFQCAVQNGPLILRRQLTCAEVDVNAFIMAWIQSDGKY